jgi:hypothetical protein
MSLAYGGISLHTLVIYFVVGDIYRLVVRYQMWRTTHGLRS